MTKQIDQALEKKLETAWENLFKTAVEVNVSVRDDKALFNTEADKARLAREAMNLIAQKGGATALQMAVLVSAAEAVAREARSFPSGPLN